MTPRHHRTPPGTPADDAVDLLLDGDLTAAARAEVIASIELDPAAGDRLAQTRAILADLERLPASPDLAPRVLKRWEQRRSSIEHRPHDGTTHQRATGALARATQAVPWWRQFAPHAAIAATVVIAAGWIWTTLRSERRTGEHAAAVADSASRAATTAEPPAIGHAPAKGQIASGSRASPGGAVRPNLATLRGDARSIRPLVEGSSVIVTASMGSGRSAVISFSVPPSAARLSPDPARELALVVRGLGVTAQASPWQSSPLVPTAAAWRVEQRPGRGG